jgi:microsomal dipeptidase-like Zn-dependent dipeptidase
MATHSAVERGYKKSALKKILGEDFLRVIRKATGK